jgi:uncharacterized MAPEG superfamily protein
MSDAFLPYAPVAGALMAMGVLCLIQALVADVAGMRAGHVPGMPIAGGHDNFLFRAARAQGNTNENLGTFIMLALSAVALDASPAWTNGLAWVFVAARLGHMLTYYMDLRPARSACFGVGLLALIGLAVIATSAWL